jgi:guanylate kinase
MLNRGRLIVLSAPSGGGKTTLRDRLRRRMPDLQYSVSATSRIPRDGEEDGKDYCFLSGEVFRMWIKEGKFIEWANVHGNLYGTPRMFIEENLKQGKDILLDIDVKGALEIKKQFPETFLVFVAPPSIAVLEKRLRRRGTDTSEEIKKRILTATDEMCAARDYDCVILNENLEDALAELEGVVRSYRESGRLPGL